MKISLVPMRALPAYGPSTSRQSLSRSGSSPVIPAPPARAQDAAPSPAAVAPATWSLLTCRLAEVQSGSAIANAEFRSAVRAVVRELRAHGEVWDDVYATLASAAHVAPGHAVTRALDLEVYATRRTSIVAHMHCWADVERLAEIEEEGLAS